MKRLAQRSAALVLLAGSLVAGAGEAADAPARDGRPNIVFVLIDDAGWSDLGSYGSEIATPHLDEIARSGVRFANFHTASTCEPSRAMLQSGVDSHRAGAGTLQAVIAENQRGKPGYEGYLSDDAHSLGQLMRDGGYATYYAGKWNLGDGLERSPGAKGWDRYIALEQTGADNFEAKAYIPLNAEAVWWEDGQRARLPPDFYSSRHYVDKLIQFIDEGRAHGKPFLAMLSFQAVHSPLQAPQADIERYLARYQAGWGAVRAERYRRQVELGLVPAGLELPRAAGARDWEQLDETERREQAKKMAVYAGMLDQADQQVGRLREHLRAIGELDDSAFIVMSDNGADAYDLSRINPLFALWYRTNFALGHETLGQPGSYAHYGQDWAEVSNTPLRSFKGTANEGGLRVPFIVSHPARIAPGGVTHAFAYATDFLPTVLDIAGIALPGDEYGGRKLHRPTGTSLLLHLEGKTPVIHSPTESIGFEGTGSQALYRGDYKAMRSAGAFSDGSWRLYQLVADPTESNDLAAREPDRLREMLAEVELYNASNGVVLPGPDYDPGRQILVNSWRVLLQELGPLFAGTALALVAVIALLVGLLRRLRRAAPRRAPA